MNRYTKISLISVVFVAAVSFMLSIFYGNQGVEAFFSLFIATGILYTTSVRSVIKLLLRSHIWVLYKTIILMFVIVTWLLILLSIIVIITLSFTDTSNNVIEVDWKIVVISSLAFIFQLIYYSDIKKKNTTQHNIIQATSSILSIVILFISFIGFIDTRNNYNKAIILVLSVNTVYVANYIYSNTNYIKIINSWSNKSFGKKSELNKYIQILIISLPYLLPILVLFAF